MISSRNPFRNPSPARSSTTTRTSSNGHSGSREDPLTSSDQHPESAERGTTPIQTSVNDILTEEQPPAYTPSPNVYEGETTLELGPRRPFQQPVAPPPRGRSQHQFPPQSWTPSQPSGSWSAFPGQGYRDQPQPGFYPPPVHPELVRTASRPISAPNITVSDFARDFYQAGAGDSEPYGGVSSQFQSERSGPASPASPTSQYGPPPGEPPNRPNRNGPSSSTRNNVSDDGRPTDQPVPGHPLLHDGKYLAYPQGYECHKCHNTGYKGYDPSNPCARCWDKYSKSYSGPVTYAPWPSASDSSSSSSKFQRALPAFRPPQGSLHQHSPSRSGSTPLGSNLSRAATTSRVNGFGYSGTGASAHAIPIGTNGVLPRLGGFSESASRRSQMGMGMGFPPNSWAPPGQLETASGSGSGPVAVYAPGDTRIGGRLCWRCGGRGKTSFLIFDDVCSICNGAGRTFV